MPAVPPSLPDAETLSVTRDLTADASVTRGELVLTAHVTARAGAVLGVVGPNGAGKTTLLRVLAGLTAVDTGVVQLGERVLDHPATGVWVPPHERRIGVVFQEPRLFAHLSVMDNVAFALRSGGLTRRASRAAVGPWLERFDLLDVSRRAADELSGGQAARVALARAMAADPMALLLDEPTASLDPRYRSAVRAELRRHLDLFDGPVVIVTHDPLEAMTLADDLVVLEAGHVVQRGSPSEVARRPATDYVARFVGLNVYRGIYSRADRRVQLESGGSLVAAAGEPLPDATPVLAAVRPGAISVHTVRPEHISTRNVWPGSVRGVDIHADRVRLDVAGAPGHPSALVDVTLAAVADLGLHTGLAVWLSVKASEIEAYASTAS